MIILSINGLITPKSEILFIYLKPFIFHQPVSFVKAYGRTVQDHSRLLAPPSVARAAVGSAHLSSVAAAHCSPRWGPAGTAQKAPAAIRPGCHPGSRCGNFSTWDSLCALNSPLLSAVSAMASPSFTTCCGFSLQRETEAGVPGRPRGLMGERSTRAQTCLPAASIASDPQRERPCCGRDGSVHEAQRLVCVLGAVAGGFTEDATCAGGQPWGQEPPRVPAPGGCLALVRGVAGGK